MAAELVIKDVHTHYGVSHVLHGVSMELEKGGFVCLLGRNGMGKTTLLRSVMGLTPATSGTIMFRGRNIEKYRPYEIFDLGVGYVPQGRRMFPRLTVHENLRMGLRDKRKKEPPILDKLYTYFPVLAKRRKQQAGTLSGGEQQMLAIARSLAGEVGILLLDEPTEGVQPSIVDMILDLLVVINREQGLALLLVEQNMELALSVARKYYIMSRGLIAEEGQVKDIDRDSVVERYMCV